MSRTLCRVTYTSTNSISRFQKGHIKTSLAENLSAPEAGNTGTHYANPRLVTFCQDSPKHGTRVTVPRRFLVRKRLEVGVIL